MYLVSKIYKVLRKINIKKIYTFIILKSLNRAMLYSMLMLYPKAIGYQINKNSQVPNMNYFFFEFLIICVLKTSIIYYAAAIVLCFFRT